MAKGNVLRAIELPSTATEPVGAGPLRLDLGAGKTTPDGWEGVDAIDFGQKHVFNLVAKTPTFTNSHDPSKPHGGEFIKWPWADNSVDEVRSSHFVEHLTGEERIFFFNELWRVMKDGATALIVTPNWSHSCAYGDPTHQWPPMSQWYPLYLHKDWRAANAPHAPYTCHFDHVIAASWDGKLEVRNGEYKNFALDNYTNSFRDLIVTLTCRKS